ncbi:NfeD family protein [Actinospongicola halichondriae]|uniref:NfeD family protein n=1 Tax=Actinospongicola halichondriae TaxID=3236844 RepID=UPI003D47E297
MGVTLLAGTASARPAGEATDDAEPGIVQVIKVSGLLDPIVVSFIEDQIATATADDVVALVLQINSEGAVVGDDDMDRLVDTIERADVTVAAWVGPSGSKAEGDATRLVAAADVSALTPGSRIEVTKELADGIDLDGKASVGEKAGSETAAELGLVDNAAPVLGTFIVDLPGVETRVVNDRREPVTRVRFGQLGLIDQLFHTVASPAAAYLLLIIGGCLLVFELFTAGVGVAGMVGVGSLVLSAYGLAVLPTNTWALVVLCAAFPAFAVDVQTGVPRFWTGVGVVALLVGSLTVFVDGPPSWITLIAGILGTLLSMLGGMPAMVRTRFSTPTIGRDWMIGESGIALADVSPDGVVTVRDAPWRAHTNRATPIAAGEAVKVTAIDGLVLEVEPVEGAAKDYRDRR